MSEFQKIKFSVATSTIVAVFSSLIAGLLLAYFTNIIFKPEVLYTVSSSKITLPVDYEKELAKVRALLMLRNLEATFKNLGKNLEIRKELSIKPGIKDQHIGIKEHEMNFFAGHSGKLGDNSVGLEGKDLNKMIDTLEKPELLRTLLDPAITFPTAFATVDIYNAGNREANDLELKIMPNGVLVEALIDSTEPSAEKWEDVYDGQTLLPVGVHLLPVKRLPPGGKIRVKIYWNLLGKMEAPSDKDIPLIDVKGSYSGGNIQFVNSKPESPINWPLWIIIGLSICLSGTAIGYWLRGLRLSST